MGTLRVVRVAKPGSNYQLPPAVVLTGDGVGAAASATLIDGKVSRIVVDNPGINYTWIKATIVANPGDPGSGAIALAGVVPEPDVHLLPNNATVIEKAFAASLAQINDIDIPIGTLWDPDKCPIALLPWLAWTVSVDSWDTNWSEADKRQAVKDAIPLARHKGTKAALTRALKPFSPDYTFKEWFEYGAPAYHFRVSTTPDPGAFPELAELIRVWSTTLNAKNVRSYPELYVVIQTAPGTVYAGGAISINSVLSNEPASPWPLTMPVGFFSMGAAAFGTSTIINVGIPLPTVASAVPALPITLSGGSPTVA